MPIRPTTADIAKVAQVSLATVDRVLNERTGVSVKTQARVNQAIDTLGYVRDVTAANLARKREYTLVFVVPEGPGLFEQTLQTEIKDLMLLASRERTKITLLTVPQNDPHTLVTKLRALHHQSVDGVAIMAPETPHVRDAISDLKQQGIVVIALVSDQPKSCCDHFVGINNVAAGRTAAVLMGRFLAKTQGDVLVLTNTMHAHDSINRRLGFDEVMNEQFPLLRVMPTLEGHGESNRVTLALKNALKASSNVVGVYSLSSGNRALTTYMSSLKFESKLVVVAHELTPHTQIALKDGTVDAVINQNIGHIVRSALRILRAKSDRIEIDTSQECIRIEIVMKENLV